MNQIRHQSQKRKKNQGQALIEFVLLLVIVMGLSLGMKRVVMNKMGEMWKSMVDIICFPDKASFR